MKIDYAFNENYLEIFEKKLFQKREFKIDYDKIGNKINNFTTYSIKAGIISLIFFAFGLFMFIYTLINGMKDISASYFYLLIGLIAFIYYYFTKFSGYRIESNFNSISISIDKKDLNNFTSELNKKKENYIINQIDLKLELKDEEYAKNYIYNLLESNIINQSQFKEILQKSKLNSTFNTSVGFL